MHVLFIAGWSDPFGDFTKEHAYSIAPLSKVSYVFVEFVKTAKYFPFKAKREDYRLKNVDHYFIKIYCPLRRFKVYEFLIKREYTKIIKSVEKKGKLDICHINVRTPVTELVPALKIINNLPIVITEHSSFYHTGIYKSFKEAALEKEITRIKLWFSNPRFKYVLPVSNQLGKVLITDFGVSENKIQKIPNIAAHEFRYEPVTPNGKINIVLIATWTYPKNPFLFLKALNILPPEIVSKLSVSWIGGGEQLTEIKEFVAQHLKQVEVSFIGIISERKEIAGYYQRADIFVHPSDAENLPCVIIESLCCGTPVVSNSINGILELVNESNGLLSPIKDEKAMADNLIYMINNLDKYNRKNIAEQAQKLYYPEPIGEQIFSVYKKALAKKNE